MKKLIFASLTILLLTSTAFAASSSKGKAKLGPEEALTAEIGGCPLARDRQARDANPKTLINNAPVEIKKIRSKGSAE